jgi:hypothetical protein
MFVAAIFYPTINFGRLRSVQRLRQMRRLDGFASTQICNRARQFQNAMTSCCAYARAKRFIWFIAERISDSLVSSSLQNLRTSAMRMSELLMMLTESENRKS